MEAKKKKTPPKSVYSNYSDKRRLSLDPAKPKTDKDKEEKEISKETIDSIARNPEKDWLIAYRLKQGNFEYLAERYGKQFKRLTLWHCPRIGSLKPLELFPNLEIFEATWNQLVTDYWDFRKNPKLSAIQMEGFNKLDHFDPLPDSPGLKEFSFTMGINNNKSQLKSLAPLAELPHLWDLEVRADKILDPDITPLGKIPSLKKLGLPTNLFDLPLYAWLKARIGDRVESDILDQIEDSVTIGLMRQSGEVDETVYAYPIVLGLGQRAGQ